ncbi:NAD(P)H-hydrate epimerase, partial [Burkholderia ubonensis]
MTLAHPAHPLPAPEPIALLRVADLRAAETAAAAALPPHTLMARAGAAAARWLSERVGGDDRPVWFAVGPGNNGGDALVAAAELQRLGVATH